jgi:hypothetical protein
MSPKQDEAGLNQGGPGEQRSPRESDTDAARTGSSQGGAPLPGDDGSERLPSRKPGPPVHGADNESDDVERGASATERDAGTPDDRATTDGQHGEGEPARR